MPTHGVAVYGEAILAMDGQLYHFYRDDNRYYFDAQENLNKVANDRAAELTNEAVNAEIVRRLNEFASLSENRAVLVCPQSPSDVPDRDFVRLVILRPDQTRPSRAGETDQASEAATLLLQNCADDARTHQAQYLAVSGRCQRPGSRPAPHSSPLSGLGLDPQRRSPVKPDRRASRPGPESAKREQPVRAERVGERLPLDYGAVPTRPGAS